MSSQPSIFISIASYRDPELIPTLENLLHNWSTTIPITINVCLQDTEAFHRDLLGCNFPHLVVDFIDYKKSKGVCWARKRLQGWMNDETHFLQIDSHIRFIRDWDRVLIRDLERTQADKPIISCYPPRYDRQDSTQSYLAEKFSNLTEYKELLPNGAYIVVGGKYNKTGRPLANVRLSAGFVFTLAKWVAEIPYPDNVYFNGEEDWLTVMSYTKGWDIFCPTQPIVFHCYQDNREESSEKYRPLHWEDHGEQSNILPIFEKLYQGEYSEGQLRSVDQLFKCIQKQTPRKFAVFLNLAGIPKGKYKVWIFCLLDGKSKEIYRQDITDQAILSHQSNLHPLECDNDVWAAAERYMIWPMDEKDEFGEKHFAEIHEWRITSANQTILFHKEKNPGQGVDGGKGHPLGQRSPVYRLEIDFSHMPPEKYKLFVFCLLDGNDREIYRQDIHDQAILHRRENLVPVHCSYYIRELAAKYMIWPVDGNEIFREKIVSDIKEWHLFYRHKNNLDFLPEQGISLIDNNQAQTGRHTENAKFHTFLWGIAPKNRKPFIYYESRHCLQSAGKFGLTPEIIGLGFDDGKGPRNIQSQNRFHVLLERLQTIPDDHIVLVMDSFDTLFCGTDSEIITRFESFQTEILFSAERCFTYQWFEYQQNYETTPSPYKYLNAGTYIGYAHALKRFTRQCIRMTGEDRYKNGFEMGIMGAYLHENISQVSKYRLDTNCDLFWVTTREPHVDFKKNKLYNPTTGTVPLVLHFIDAKRFKQHEYQNCFERLMKN